MDINTTVNTKSRRITTTYTEGTYRVKVSTTHSKNYKIYRTIVSECIVEINETYTMERFTMFQDFNQSIQSIPAPRYNAQKLQEAHESGVKIATGVEFGSTTSLVTSLFQAHDAKKEVA